MVLFLLTTPLSFLCLQVKPSLLLLGITILTCVVKTVSMPTQDSFGASSANQPTRRTVAWLRARLHYLKTTERYYQQLFVLGLLDEDSSKALGKCGRNYNE